VIANGRVGKLGAVLASVSKLMAAERNEIKVVLTTAGKVVPKQMEEMKALLLYRVKKQYGSTAQMLLSTAVRSHTASGLEFESSAVSRASPSMRLRRRIRRFSAA
jgi:F0F1-type ATP synthase delta subunit